MNQTSDPHPDFEIEFSADEMEPLADVAPAGDVTFQLVNGSDAPHGFALLRVDQTEREWRDTREPVTEDDLHVVGVMEEIPPHAARAATWRLDSGHYVLISNTPGDRLGTSVFELTVQSPEA